jgi:hypothetical protein
MFTSNRSLPDEDHDEDQAPDAGPEVGEGGPLERTRAFMEQRLAALRPRQAPPGELATPPSPDQPTPEGEEGSLPPDFRQRLMAEYRQRKRSAPPADAPTEPVEAPPGGKEGTNDA